MAALFIYLMAIVCWLGGMLFFAFCAAPVIFTRLPITEAGKVIAGIFPLYYKLAYVAGGIAVLLAFYMVFSQAAKAWWTASAVLLAIALGLMVYSGVVLTPKIDAVRGVVEQTNPDPARKARFDALHRLSVQLNGAAIVLEVLAVLTTAGALL